MIPLIIVIICLLIFGLASMLAFLDQIWETLQRIAKSLCDDLRIDEPFDPKDHK